MRLYPVPAKSREPFDVLDLVQGTDDDEFIEGLHDAYLLTLDTRADEIPAMTCDGLVAFMRGLMADASDMSERYRLGYIAGVFMALGESEPRFAWTSADPPIQAVRCESEPSMR